MWTLASSPVDWLASTFGACASGVDLAVLPQPNANMQTNTTKELVRMSLHHLPHLAGQSMVEEIGRRAIEV
jgi:hypothetical protein